MRKRITTMNGLIGNPSVDLIVKISRQIEECTKAGSHIRLLRIRDYHTGKESLMIQKRAEIKEDGIE
jgi:hypothetical protein